MFVVNLTYKAPLDEIDRVRDAHMEWVKAGYADGIFIASGAKRPRTGGVILARGAREALACAWRARSTRRTIGRGSVRQG